MSSEGEKSFSESGIASEIGYNYCSKILKYQIFKFLSKERIISIVRQSQQILSCAAAQVGTQSL